MIRCETCGHLSMEHTGPGSKCQHREPIIPVLATATCPCPAMKVPVPA